MLMCIIYFKIKSNQQSSSGRPFILFNSAETYLWNTAVKNQSRNTQISYILISKLQIFGNWGSAPDRRPHATRSFNLGPHDGL